MTQFESKYSQFGFNNISVQVWGMILMCEPSGVPSMSVQWKNIGQEVTYNNNACLSLVHTEAPITCCF